MKEEIADLQRQMIIEETYTEQGYGIYKGRYGNKDVLLAQTGIGKEKAERTAKYILEHYPITAMVCLGFAGALVKGLEVGDVVLGTVLHCEDNQIPWKLGLQNPLYSDVNLVSIASRTQEDIGSNLQQASSVTVLNPVCEPESKLALGNAFSAQAVDMESYWIAEIALDKCIPFLNIRVISDTVEDRLPPFDRFLFSGSWRWKMAIPYFLIHPHQLAGLFCLYRNSCRARKSLSNYMDSFISKL